MNNQRWIKSSYTSANGNCVEVASTLDHVRDSKDPQGPMLKADLRRFIVAVKAGRFDR